jgi:hypothetical protein
MELPTTQPISQAGLLLKIRNARDQQRVKHGIFVAIEAVLLDKGVQYVKHLGGF